MDLSRAAKLIKSLERDPEHVQTYYGDLDAAIRWLMDTTFEATDAKEKARLAATEMRARLVLEAFRKRGTN
ncbi:MAG: hypothetical protein JSU86_16505 [Phycisphaerales bacterium]|nr:MAG: hypothetical protein JSU86_16505 [Phycisphaerales bacterium]